MSNFNDRDDVVRPQVIDVEAEEIIEPADQPSPKLDKPLQKPTAKRWAIPALALAFVTGLGGGSYLYRDVLSRYFPNDEISTLTERVAVVEAEAKARAEKSAQVASLIEQLASSVNRIETATQTLKADGVEKQKAIDAALAATAKTVEQLKTALANQPANSGPTFDPSVFAQLSDRLDAVEQNATAQKSAAEASPQIAAALAALKVKADAGQAFTAELELLRGLMPDAQGLNALAPLASGVADVASLSVEMTAAIAAISTSTLQATGGTTENSGTFANLKNYVSSIITIRDARVPQWQDAAQKLAKDATTGDLEKVVAAIDALPSPRPEAFAKFRQVLTARLSLQQNLSTLSDAVMRHIAATPAAATSGATP